MKFVNSSNNDMLKMLKFLYYSSVNLILATKRWGNMKLTSSTFPLALWCSGSRRISSVTFIHSATFSGEMKCKTTLIHDCGQRIESFVSYYAPTDMKSQILLYPRLESLQYIICTNENNVRLV